MKDPVITWLENVRDQPVVTDHAREMATQAIARLEAAAAAAPDLDAPQKSVADRKIDGIVDAAAAENAKAGKSIADEKIDRITGAAREETERGRAARRQP